MEPAEGQRRADFFVRALAVVVGVSLAHLLLGDALVTALAPGDRAATDGVRVSALSTAVVMLAVLYVRTQYSSPAHAARSLPTALRVTPVLALFLLLPVLYSPEALEGAGAFERVSAPLAATASAAILLSIPLSRILHALGIRSPVPTYLGLLREAPPPSLSSTYLRILVTASVGVTIVVAGTIAAAHQGALDEPRSWVPLLAGLLGLSVAAMLAGTSLGQTPGEDLTAIAARLDDLGHLGRGSMTAPVAVPSADEVGNLLANLDRLRARLEGESGLYEDALVRTRRADAAKAGFLHAVSHELRTPLNSVGGFAQLLLEGHGGPLSDGQAEDVRLIRAGGHQLLELLNDILDLSMIESGEVRLQFSRADIGSVVREVVDIHQPLVREREVALVAEIGPDLPAVECDRRRIGQILTNLVSNAIKFTESGRIAVRAAFDPQNDRVIVRCIDTGIGIAADELDAIFEQYRQAGPRARRKKGTGLGLAIARTIAEHHGGSLSVESIAGAGSTFTLLLPREPPERPSAIDVAERAARARVGRIGEEGSP